MGAIENGGGSGNTRYLTVVEGTLRQRVDKGHPKAVARVNKKGVEVFEQSFDAYSGYLRDIEFKKGDYGWELRIKVDDVGESGQIQISRDSDFFLDFANRMLSVAPKTIAEHPVVISVFQMDREGSEFKNGYMIPMFWNFETKQYEKAMRKYTKDHPGDMPQWEQVDDPKTGEKTWSKLKQLAFLSKELNDLITEAKGFMGAIVHAAPAFGTPAAANTQAPVAEKAQAPAKSAPASEGISDLERELEDVLSGKAFEPPVSKRSASLDLDDDDHLPF